MGGLLAAGLASEARANLDGNDDFSGLFANPNKWIRSMASGYGGLNQANRRLECTTGGGLTTYDLVALQETEARPVSFSS